MPHRLIEHVDSFVIGLIAVVSALGAQIVTNVTQADELAELRILMVPLVSSLISTGGLYLFNIGKEPRNLVLGRAVFALLFGSSLIGVISIVVPSWEPVLRRAIILLPGGALASMFFFYLSYPLARALNKRSDGLADSLLDQAERKTGLNSKDRQP